MSYLSDIIVRIFTLLVPWESIFGMKLLTKVEADNKLSLPHLYKHRYHLGTNHGCHGWSFSWATLRHCPPSIYKFENVYSSFLSHHLLGTSRPPLVLISEKIIMCCLFLFTERNKTMSFSQILISNWFASI